METQVVDVLREDNPQSVRHVFYRMTDPRLPVPIAKSEAGYGQIQQRLVSMRRAKRIPYHWITDATRVGYHVPEFDDTASFIRDVAGLYRQRLWTEDLPRVECWVESRSIASVLLETCKDLRVSLFPCAGGSSISFAYESAMHVNRLGRPLEVLYVGDRDPGGVIIEESLERELREHLTVPLEIRRLAVTQAQVEAYDLPAKARKPSEKRRPEILSTVEAEALPAGALRRIVRDAVEAYLPSGALAAVKIAEASERRYLETFAFAS